MTAHLKASLLADPGPGAATSHLQPQVPHAQLDPLSAHYAREMKHGDGDSSSQSLSQQPTSKQDSKELSAFQKLFAHHSK